MIHAMVSDTPTPGAKRGRGRPAIHDEATMLDGAARALVRRGYSELRYSDVSDEVGVPVPSLQNRFKTLDNLRREALRRKVRLELEELVATLAGFTDPWVWVTEMITVCVALDPDRRQAGWALWVEYHHAAAHDELMAEDLREVDEAWLAVLIDVIERGTAQGRFAPAVPAREAAVLVQGVIDGLGLGLCTPQPDERARAVIDLLTTAAALVLRPT